MEIKIYTIPLTIHTLTAFKVSISKIYYINTLYYNFNIFYIESKKG